jgi:dTDP-4-dehydrorhamnose 3,5-epimerase
VNFTGTGIRDLYIIEPKVFEDSRGYFLESYNDKKFKEAGITYKWLQDNQSKSSKGVIRGLHYQKEPHAQTKLIRVLEGAILDVAVDIREGSPTYGKVFSVELSALNHKQLLVPKGFAHGFSVLSNTAVVFYKCDNLYNPASEGGIIYNDKDLNIDWGISKEEAIISSKDAKLPPLEKAEINFKY